VQKKKQPPTVAKTLEEGIAEGGQVLWTEPEKDFNKRRSDRELGMGIAGGGFLSLPILFSAILVGAILQPVPQNPLPLLAALTVMALLVIALLAWFGFTLVREALAILPTLKPRILFEQGIAVGEGARPYFPFDKVIGAEEGKGVRSKTPFVLIAFDGGEFLRISKGRVHNSIQVDDFEAVRQALAAVKPMARDAAINWEPEAAAWVEGMRALRVAGRSLFERLAREQGVSRIDLAFLRANWKKARAAYFFEDLPGWRDFQRQLERVKTTGTAGG
jgi:hypothetical protein